MPRINRVLLLSVIAVVGCDSYQTNDHAVPDLGSLKGRPILNGLAEFESFAYGDFSNFLFRGAVPARVDTQLVFRTESEWRDWWESEEFDVSEHRVVPDFDNYMVLGVIFGWYPWGCPGTWNLVQRINVRVDHLKVVMFPMPDYGGFGSCQAVFHVHQFIRLKPYPQDVRFVYGEDGMPTPPNW